MKRLIKVGALMCVAAAVVTLRAAETKVDLSKETVGKSPATFQAMVGTWLVAQEPSTGSGQAAEKVIKIDGAGLQPQLEAFMWEILKAIQVRVNQDGLKLLLGL